ncbi:hypothetical protein Pelo_18541 [Pelomyxa schiedti]|nr:hypothetical protein Pelo_18541 [Pelomyxa schiedti]
MWPQHDPAMEFAKGPHHVVLRARDQLGALASACVVGQQHQRLQNHTPQQQHSDDAPGATTTATASAAALATWGHVVARLVWGVVASTARVFVFEVKGREKERAATGDDGDGDGDDDDDDDGREGSAGAANTNDYYHSSSSSQGGLTRRCLCVRLSPLLLSIVGDEVEDRAAGVSSLWVRHNMCLMSYRNLYHPATGRKWAWHSGYDGGFGKDLFEEPMSFHNSRCDAVNYKWIVALGAEGGGARNLLQLHCFNSNTR